MFKYHPNYPGNPIAYNDQAYQLGAARDAWRNQ
jgi:hypothetical protein